MDLEALVSQVDDPEARRAIGRRPVWLTSSVDRGGHRFRDWPPLRSPRVRWAIAAGAKEISASALAVVVDRTRVLHPLTGADLWSSNGPIAILGDVAIEVRRRELVAMDAWTGHELWRDALLGQLRGFGLSEGVLLELSRDGTSARPLGDLRSPPPSEPIWVHGPSDGARVEAVSPDAVIFGYAIHDGPYEIEGRVLALDLATGARRFEITDWKNHDNPHRDEPARRRRIVADDLGFVAEIALGCGELMSGSTRYQAIAFDPAGRTLWSRSGDLLGAPALGPELAVLSQHRRLEIVARATGEPRARAPEAIAPEMGVQSCDAISATRDAIYVAHGDGVCAMAPDGTIAWALRSKELPPGRVRAVAAAPGRLYGLTSEGFVFCASP